LGLLKTITISVPNVTNAANQHQIIACYLELPDDYNCCHSRLYHRLLLQPLTARSEGHSELNLSWFLVLLMAFWHSLSRFLSPHLPKQGSCDAPEMVLAYFLSWK
jgi:hypothetical protein